MGFNTELTSQLSHAKKVVRRKGGLDEDEVNDIIQNAALRILEYPEVEKQQLLESGQIASRVALVCKRIALDYFRQRSRMVGFDENTTSVEESSSRSSRYYTPDGREFSFVTSVKENLWVVQNRLTKTGFEELVKYFSSLERLPKDELERDIEDIIQVVKNLKRRYRKRN